MKIGIIGAMEIEVNALIRSMKDPKLTRISMSDFYEGEIEGVMCVVARCGIGKVAAAVTAQTMILHFAPELIINTGVGGALASELKVGDIVISSRALQYDMDTSPLGDPVGLISGINQIYFEADKKAADELVKIAVRLGNGTMRGTVCSGDRFVASVEEKERILSHFPDGAVCEMEGAAIAHTAYLANVPFVIVRAISDSADGSSHVDYMTFLADAAARSYEIVRQYIKDSKNNFAFSFAF